MDLSIIQNTLNADCTSNLIMVTIGWHSLLLDMEVCHCADDPVLLWAPPKSVQVFSASDDYKGAVNIEQSVN